MMRDASPPIVVSNLKWNPKNTLPATADVEVPKWRRKIRIVMWHANNGKDWLFFPSREWVDRNGQRQFAVLLDEFTDKDIERWSQQAALVAVRDLADRVALGGTP